jgi:hypothetical protein
MDIFSHGLWAAAAYRGVNLKYKTKLRLWWPALWAVFPDFFAFTIPFVWMIFSLLTGERQLSDFPHPKDAEPMQPDTIWVFKFSSALYTYSHSIFIFAIVFGLVWLIARRPVWTMGGWLIHILMDIPTHSYKFYPTPFLWPVSSYKFDGISWGQPWFMAVDASLLIIIYLVLFWPAKWRFKK